VTSGARERRAERRVVKAENKYARQEIKKIARENPPFVAILQGVDPESDRPPPYQNVRVNVRAP